MDNHPIPQDVTGFQFRLIGNMTVKQFAYVAVGAVGAVIIFYLPIFALIKVVLIPLFIISGVSLAFLPVEGRPVDIMVTHFIKAIISPTQFLYRKTGGHLLLSTIHIDQKAVNQVIAETARTGQSAVTQEQRHVERRQQLSAYLTSIHQNQAADDKEAGRISALFTATPAGQTPVDNVTTTTASLPVQTPVAIVAPITPEPVAPPLSVETVSAVIQSTTPEVTETPIVTPTPEVTPVEAVPATTTPDADTLILMQKDTEKISEEESLMVKMNDELTRAKAAETGTDGKTDQSAHGKVLEMEQKLNELMQAKQQLEAELQSLKTAQTKKIIATPSIPSIPVQPAAPITKIAAEQTANASIEATGFPSLPDFPNILLGVVRDSSGNVLPHILVDVKDADDNPVRAFKTNQLGQFLSATPLKEGNYTIHLEDAKNQYKFEVYPVTVNGTILPPLQIAAHDLREELRKSLFA